MYRILSNYLILCVQFSVIVSTDSNNGLSPEQIVEKYGYPFEAHTVQTSDGYLLTLHRIPYGVKNSSLAKTRPPVLLVHGMLSSSADFIVMGPNQSLSFQLADAGYDVWLANCRGNTWSRKHITIDPDKDSAKFFNFSFQEHGMFDLPAKIDYILSTTKQDSLFYVGHSLGTTSSFVLLSSKPEYNRKVKLAANLAPIAYFNHEKSALTVLEDLDYNVTAGIVHFLGLHEIASRNSTSTQLIHFICEIPIVREVLVFATFLTIGFDSPQLDRNKLPTITTNFPAGGSVKQLLYYLQIRQSGRFAQYDYGSQWNLEVYHRAEPPVYNLSKITAPVILHYSENDYLASVEDVARLASELPNAKLKLVPLPAFNHLDHLYAKDVRKLLYNDIIQELELYN